MLQAEKVAVAEMDKGKVIIHSLIHSQTGVCPECLCAGTSLVDTGGWRTDGLAEI